MNWEENKEDLQIISEFLNSDTWDTIVNDAVYTEDPDSVDLMEDILLRMKSAEYFLSVGAITRHEMEVQQLASMANNFIN
jgi:hypothetical protein